MAAPSTGLAAARQFVEAYARVKGLYQQDINVLKNLLDATGYIVRSEISTNKWAFARFREVLTAAATENSGSTAVLVPSAKWGSELTLVQLTPTDEEGPLTYIDPANFEALVAENVTSDQDPKVYTIYNANEFWCWPAASAGDTFQLSGELDLADNDTELPLRFAAYLACVFLYYIGAPPPNDHVTWMDSAKKKLEQLKDIDRPSSRGGNFDVPYEEASFVLGNI